MSLFAQKHHNCPTCRCTAALEPVAAPDPAAIREAALQPLLDLVEEFVTATWHLLDNSETSGPVNDPTITVWQPDFDEVSKLLDRCEGLPSGSTEHTTAGELLVANILAKIKEQTK